MTATRRTRRLVTSIAVLGLAGAVFAGPVGGPEPTASAQSPSAMASGGEYHPLTPARVLDTRHGINDVAPFGKKPTTPGGSSFTVRLLGQQGIPANAGDVLAIVANVTVANPSHQGYLRIRPDGAAPTDASLVNFNAARDVPNMVIVGLGAGGGVTIDLVSPPGNGSANVIIDVYGWISKSAYPDPSDAGARLIPISPTRILDTRSAPVPPDWPSGWALQSKWELDLPVRGSLAVPNDPNITGVLVNITAVNVGGGYTYVAATPEDTPAGSEPPTSVTNLVGGQTKANTAIVPIGADGKIRLFNSGSNTHLIVDVLGYLQKGHAATSTTGRVIPLSAPFRAFDTRQPAFGKAPLGFATSESWSFKAFADSVQLNGTPVTGQSALIGNLTATELAKTHPSTPGHSFLTVYPGDVALPNSSIVNFAQHEDVPNTALIKYGALNGDPNVVRVFNDTGSVHYLLDVFAVVLS